MAKGHGKLKTLWVRLGFGKKGIGAYADFKDNAELRFVWRGYVTDESLDRLPFRGVDRIKLTNMMLERMIHMRNAIRSTMITEVFPFHNAF